MLKNKLFYFIFLVFLFTSEDGVAQSGFLFNSFDLMTEKTDEYWDLAWHARLADYGDRESQFIIANVYEQGTQVPRNMKKAVFFYKKAAQNGHLEAMMKLGHLYAEGKLIQKDEKQSFFWYESAAQKGYTPAQLKISELYQTKKFLDYSKAYYWLAKALKTMFPDVSDLESVSPDLKKIAFQLTPEAYQQVQNELR